MRHALIAVLLFTLRCGIRGRYRTNVGRRAPAGAGAAAKPLTCERSAVRSRFVDAIELTLNSIANAGQPCCQPIVHIGTNVATFEQKALEAAGHIRQIHQGHTSFFRCAVGFAARCTSGRR